MKYLPRISIIWFSEQTMLRQCYCRPRDQLLQPRYWSWLLRKKPLSLEFGSGSNVIIPWEAVSTNHRIPAPYGRQKFDKFHHGIYFVASSASCIENLEISCDGGNPQNLFRVLRLMRPGWSVEIIEWEFLYSIDNFQNYHVHFLTVSSALYQECRYFHTYTCK